MRTLSIDIETFSSVDLAKSGVYRYAEAPDFEILLFGYSVDAGPVQVVDFACGEKIPKEIQQAYRSTLVYTLHLILGVAQWFGLRTLGFLYLWKEQQS